MPFYYCRSDKNKTLSRIEDSVSEWLQKSTQDNRAQKFG